MTLVTGGSKCGKSRYAEKQLDGFHGRKFYIATMQPFGEEARRAIARHRILRAGKGFETIEQYTDIDKAELPRGCAVLLECMGNLCANEMFRTESICNPVKKIITGCEYLKAVTEELIIVTNDVGSDGIAYARGTAEYIEILGEINRRIAEISDNVIECVYGIPVPLKGTTI